MHLEVCGGCNAKIGAGDLSNILEKLPLFPRKEILAGFEGNEDGAIIQITEDIGVVTSLDFFPPMVEEAYEFGKIAAANALSDLYAMGAEPVSAMNIVCFPEEEDVRVLEEILQGGADVCKEAKTTLTGGHSIHDPKIKYGLSVIGIVDLNKVYRNNTPKVGDKLYLTKPLGVSLLMSGYTVGEVERPHYEKAVQSMATLNKAAYEILNQYEVHALTDVTGFGLLGHLSEMAEGASAVVETEGLHILEGAREAAENFLFTAGGQRNRNAYGDQIAFEIDDFALEEVLFDPQTSGGLLISVDPEDGEAMYEEMQNAGIDVYPVGKMIEAGDKSIYVR
ncbi:selenide,water dikinase [Peptoniphilus ivorii]|uniref:selenide, water dikinase SelD n=1 Tax=Aedoeadaptatus ivorii TaxID=54006 RepID=UPI002780541A|nr:selenide, water dikinase SelD [Peptoniphilus ivorii]MDQ0508001.1 selenide,water dikinase [Peptoniphilus ivorii]